MTDNKQIQQICRAQDQHTQKSVSIHINEQLKKEIKKTIPYHPKGKLPINKFIQGSERLVY